MRTRVLSDSPVRSPVVPARRYAPFLAVAAAQLVLVAVAPSTGHVVQGPAPAAALGQPTASSPLVVPGQAAVVGPATGPGAVAGPGAAGTGGQAVGGGSSGVVAGEDR